MDLVESFSGIRGIYGKGLSEELLRKYLFAYFKVFPKARERFLIAGDTRPSTSALKEAALDVLKGGEIVDAGIIPIEAAELAVLKFACQGGLYISASHNEPEYNGWKMLKEDGAILYAEQAEKVISLAHAKIEAEQTSEVKTIQRKEKEARRKYVDYVLEKLGPESVKEIQKANLKVLFDPNGGSSIGILKILAQELNLEADFVNDKPGVFGRMVEPKEESLAYLKEYFKAKDYAFAAGFDADADRVEFMTKEGLVNGNYVLALASDALLQGTKSQVVVTNDVTSYLVRDVIAKHQAVIKEVEVGETNVVSEMEKHNSIIGGEGSNGGVIMPPIKCRDGIMTTCLFLKQIAEKGKSLLDILKEYPKYFSSHNKVACEPEQALLIKQKLEDYYEKKGFLIKKTGNETGGLKAELDKNSYIWFRLSKTEPGCFRVYAETDTNQEKANNLAEEALGLFGKL